jgi:hypothetical protein
MEAKQLAYLFKTRVGRGAARAGLHDDQQMYSLRSTESLLDNVNFNQVKGTYQLPTDGFNRKLIGQAFTCDCQYCRSNLC